MATIDFLRKMTEATLALRDQNHLDVVTVSAASIPDRTASILGRGPDPLPSLLRALGRLERAGASVVAIPCNTAHRWHASLQAATALPILHIVDAVVVALEELHVRTGHIGLLATDGTIATGVYQDRLAMHGYTCRVPRTDRQAEVMHAIKLVKAGVRAAAADILSGQADLLRHDGCSAVVMGCTEIPVAIGGTATARAAWLVDATNALAGACVAMHLRERPVARS